MPIEQKKSKIIVRDGNGNLVQMLPEIAVDTALNAESALPLANSTLTQILTNDVVHTTGNETINGDKTFTGTITATISGNADTATKAEKDASGNVITTTYATKAELPADYVGATSSANGTHGLVPAAGIANKDNFLRGDGTWAEVQIQPSSIASWKPEAGVHNAGDTVNGFICGVDASSLAVGGTYYEIESLETVS